MRELIKEADPDVVEEWKWMGTPVWSHDGIVCTGKSYKKAVKLTFAKGASLKDPARLFNASLDGNVRRAIDIHEGEQVDESAFKALVRQAIALNRSRQGETFEESEVLDCDPIRLNRITVWIFVLSMIFSENRFPLSGSCSGACYIDGNPELRGKSLWPAQQRTHSGKQSRALS